MSFIHDIGHGTRELLKFVMGKQVVGIVVLRWENGITGYQIIFWRQACSKRY